MADVDYQELFHTLTRRYGTVEPEALVKVLCPLHVPIASIDRTVFKIPGQAHWRATFTVELTDEVEEALQPGRTGKFIPAAHLTGEPWREIAKGRIYEINHSLGVATGEIYVGSSGKAATEEAVNELQECDVLEVDQYGAAAKVLSALVEAALATDLSHRGFKVRRLPEDTARHIGAYYNYDFDVLRGSAVRKVEVKSLWGTDTRYARLIHSTGNDYPTSSCKFATQDIFAVSLFLRTGCVTDFAFARSVPHSANKPYGLNAATGYPDHVNQNPLCSVGNGSWYSTIEEVWDLA